MMTIITIMFCSAAIPTASSYNILLYPYSHCINSHLLNMEKMAAALLSGGHNVSFLVADTYNGPHSNVNLQGINMLYYRPPSNVKIICDYESLDTFLQTPMQELIRNFYRSTLQYCDALLYDHYMLETLKAQKYDLAIYDAVDQCSKVLAGYLDILFIAFHTHGLDTVLPRNPAYLPAMLTTYSDEMGFWQRMMNTGAYLMQRSISYLTTRFYEDLRLSHKMANNQTLNDIFNKASLKFVLGDFGLDYAGPIHPTTILLGGVIQGSAHKIPTDLQMFLDKATEGVVVFSFGSLMRKYDVHWQKIFASALGRLPYKVLWKFQGNVSVNVPDNVYLADWIPQAEILGHKSVKVFITHCGWNSAYESAYNGVPVVAIPLFGDQFFQATKITQRAKLGVQMDIKQLTSEKLYSAIMHVATTPTYKENSQYISNIMTHRLRSQKEEILYWVDLVTRLNGTNYLSSKDINLSWYQLLLLDVFLVTVLIFLSAIACVQWTCKYTYRYLSWYIRKSSKVD